MSETPNNDSSDLINSEPTRRRGLRRLVFVTLSVGVLGVLVMTVKAWMMDRVHREWKQQVEAVGAKVITAGYGRSGPLTNVPLLGELLMRRQTEVFLPDSDVARRAEPMLREAPELGRIWVHIYGIDAEHRQKLEESFPDVQFGGYTDPGE